ncbi:MAG TPA: GtrA family protein [Salinivirgaceae bacterium]|nr:GtrA family protein [Salinivirgaceae bacterium]
MFSWLDQNLIYKFIKFGIVGFSGVLVDFGITFLCKEWLKIPKYVSNAIGFTVAASTNYYLNRVWTFYSQNPNMLREYSDFFVISLIGLAINTLILYLCVKKLKLNFYLAKLIAIGVTTIWNFSANYLYTFAT